MKNELQSSSSMWPKCEFSGEACSTESTHYRKVISHIFGRNKKCTTGVPDYVWIYYCRKHYQRARYRTGEWPFRQCDLAVDTIQNMRAWGGVESFNLQLRRRETRRTTEGNETDPGGNGHISDQAPAQQYRNAERGSCDTLSDFTTINSNDAPPKVTVKLEYPDSPTDSVSEEASKRASTMLCSESGKKKSPTITARPVPDWLHHQVGNNKTFNEILQVLRELRLHLVEVTRQGQRAHFPDIEILPNLRRRIGAATPAGKSGSLRVSERGRVVKVMKNEREGEDKKEGNRK
jgi:hypothetical protein